LACLVSGIALRSKSQLFGEGAAAPSLGTAVAVAAASLCYLAALRTKDTTWAGRLAAFLIAASLGWIVAGLAVHAAQGWRIPITTLATAVLTFLAIGSAWCGTRWRRTELIWLVYALMTVAAYKLVTRDFLAHTLPLVVSLLLYGGTLLLLPKILQKRKAIKD
jgi:hypothetical protein